ncbi:baeRF6 domain-containing protein [Pediococcus pentosaceus]|uniref:baeRF6 domain-containing protein n=1 Tax=Pediococcus pentosaceus TaxID=1255 RepID=UPI0015A4CC44|nr:hypothetical protein [Pediococcus pentosaceus]NVZ01388.1 hypothetical protein [Pediococcus pentosaceus]
MQDTQKYTSLTEFLRSTQKGPFISVYMDIEPNQPVEKTSITLKNLVKHALEVLQATWDVDNGDDYRQLIDSTVDSSSLWNMGNNINSFGLITNGKTIFVQELTVETHDIAMATDLPFILPMLLDYQNRFEFYLLGISYDKIRLYDFTDRYLKELPLPDDAPKTLKKALGDDIRGGETNSVSVGNGKISVHGHNDTSAEKEIDHRRYYQIVDKYIIDNFGNDPAKPVILMGLPQNMTLFKEVNKTPNHFSEFELDLNPTELDYDQKIEDRIERFKQERNKALLEQDLDEIDKARGAALISADLNQIITSAIHGQVDTIYLAQGVRIDGRILDNEIVDTTSSRAIHNNLLSDLADLTIRNSGNVRILPEDKLNDKVIAKLRYTI